MFIDNLLILLLELNLFFIFIIAIIPKHNIKLLRLVSLYSSIILFLLSLFIWIEFQYDIVRFQFNINFMWLNFFNLHYSLGIDGLSIFFILLSTLLIPICILVSWVSVKYRLKEFLILLLLIEFLLINVFSVLDLLLFYIFFEGILIPMFILIGVWGSRSERVFAAYKFFFYTLIGSLFMLIGVLIVYSHTGSTDFFILLNSTFSESRQLLLWLSFFASFAVKIPMLPVHIWLPQAHVEAPTAGSVLLAGILLKLGGYGLLRFSLPMFPYASKFFMPLVFTMSILAIIYASCTTIRQIDLKRIIAYSSVAHMNFVTIGIFSYNLQGLEGSVLLMLSHGLVSSALFLIVGMIYDRYKTRIIRYYNGLAQIMPLFAIFFLFFTFCNISFPGTSGFIGEMLVLLGAFYINKIVAILATFGTILGAVYSVWLYNRIFFGSLNTKYINIYSDMNRREFFILFPLVILILIMGIYPNLFLEGLHLNLSNILNYE